MTRTALLSLAVNPKTKESEHAAPVALAAWVAVFWFFSWKYEGGCPSSFALFFVPLVLSALAAHKVGGLHHRERAA